MTPVSEFLAAMVAAGIRPVDNIGAALARGGLVRFRADGDKPGRENGWAVLHSDGPIPAGAFGHYRLGVHENWRSGRVEELSQQERRERARAWREERARRLAAQLAEWELAANEAQSRWNCARPASPRHPYLARKNMGRAALRQSGDRLLVPMRDGDGRLWNLQRISGDGTKRFLKGGRTRGLYWSIGQPQGVVIIGKGAATAAAVHRATGHAAAAAFSASNLEAVARTLREKFPSARLVIAADDDDHLPRNIGREAAERAALAAGACVAMPIRETVDGF